MDGQITIKQFDLLPSTAMLQSFLAARILNQDAAHGLGSGRKEVTATVPMLLFAIVHRRIAEQSQIGFVNQCGGAECLAWFFLGQFPRRQPPQFRID